MKLMQRTALALLALLASPALVPAQERCTVARPTANYNVPHRAGDPAIDADPAAALWRNAAVTAISKDCSQQIDYPWLRTEVRSFWTDSHLYLLFSCPYRELNLFLPAKGGGPRNKLWDRDVVEMFLGDDWKNIRHYREFEIAPTGDWIDLAIDLDHESDDQSWRSGWTTAAHIDEGKHIWYAAARIPLRAISAEPVKPGTKWRANLYRIDGLGADPQRRFLCWQPTCVVNRDPNHVPENFGTLTFAGDPGALAEGRRRFEARCGGCHGADGAGGERAPAIGSGERERVDSEESVRALIHSGIPDAGMPPFDIPEPELSQLVAFVRSRVTPARESMPPGDAAAGEAFFFGAGRCAQCHSMGGRGGATGPDLSNAGEELTLAEIEQSLRNPAARRKRGFEVVTVRLRSGAALRGLMRNESLYDLQLQDFDGRLHLLRREEVAGIDREAAPYMPALHASDAEMQDLIAYLVNPPAAEASVSEAAHPGGIAWARIAQPKAGDWPTYHGQLSGNRYSTLTQITPQNVARVAPRWMFPIHGARHLEVTPIVVDGLMYVTNVNAAWALDAATGREIWHYERPRSKGLSGDASGGINRGVAVLGDRVFMVTDNAHLLALDRLNGALVWDTQMADSGENYGATSAPLVVNDLVVSGTSGGDEGIRGFVAGYSAATGKRVWRFWTVPSPGEQAAATWVGHAIEHGCASTWLTGTYDVETSTLFWPVGNPCPDFNGDERKGDNLYSDSVVALDPHTGTLKWHYQFTPHDLHDSDATETPMLVDALFGDAPIAGRPPQLLLHGDRNGFFYVIDRATGKFLRATPFVHALTWASGIDKDGRPMLLPGSEPTPTGARVCPSMDGATNWMSTAFDPNRRLFYLMALEKCNIFTKSSAVWKAGESFYGGGARDVPGETPRQYLRAIDLDTGKIAWEVQQTGEAESWGGVLATSSGLLFYCDDAGAFAAVDSVTGAPLWHMHLNTAWKASPMTYLANGKQYVAIAAGGDVVSFALPE
ncbi:MAG: PQQ-binding-like beta-propeller repeat protein [Bryobacteraceae bacterium]